jgi:hypothetical protein
MIRPKWFQHWLLRVLSLAFVISGLVMLQISDGIAQQKPTPTPTPIQRSPQSSTKEKSIVDILSNLLQRAKPHQGSRNLADGVCLIAPAVLSQTNLIWSDRPLFVWRGKPQRVEVRAYSDQHDFEKQPVVWQQRVSGNAQQANNPEKPLQPGQRYDLQFYRLGDDKPREELRTTFGVMGIQQRDRIYKDLKTLETQLKAEQATQEDIVLERAQYFAKQDLWSDAVQEIYEVTNPSPKIAKVAQDMGDRACQQELTESLK